MKLVVVGVALGLPGVGGDACADPMNGSSPTNVDVAVACVGVGGCRCVVWSVGVDECCVRWGLSLKLPTATGAVGAVRLGPSVVNSAAIRRVEVAGPCCVFGAYLGCAVGVVF